MSRRSGRRAALGLALVLASAFAPRPALAESAASRDGFSFAVVGHLRGERDGEPFFLLDELLAELAERRPDLVFLTGDLIFGDWHEARADASRIAAHWDRLDAALARLGVPVYRVPGNHDVNDPVTRDLWVARYGAPPQAVSHGGSRFLLLASPYIPAGDEAPARPRLHPRGRDLAPEQIEFVRRELESAGAYEHVFLFLHHVLWWEPQSAWWRDVHPLLAGRNVHAVFGGDYGPLQFSHAVRDGIEYWQAALERRVPIDVMRRYEEARSLNFQLDPYLLVTVRGPRVDVEVEVLGARSSGKYTPELWHEVFASESGAARESGRPARARGGARRLALRAGLVAAGFAAGAVCTALVLRRRRAGSEAATAQRG